jgi:CYTH domain-containing protein
MGVEFAARCGRTGCALPGKPLSCVAMAKEIERKFMLKDDGWRAAAVSACSIVQFYMIAGPDRSVRVRIRDGEKALLTLKFGSGTRERDEFEYGIPLADAHGMRAFAVGHVIEKTRHLVRHAGHMFEVDEFHGAFEGFFMAELEIPEAANVTALPEWIGEEVTGDPAYANASFAIAGLPMSGGS